MTASEHHALMLPGTLPGRLGYLNGADTLITRHVAARHGGVVELSGDGQDDLALALLDALLSFSPAVEFGAPCPLTSHLKPRLRSGVDCTGPRVLRLEEPACVPRLVITNDPAEREYWHWKSLEEAGPPTVLLTVPVPDGRGHGVPLIRATLRGLRLTVNHAPECPVLGP